MTRGAPAPASGRLVRWLPGVGVARGYRRAWATGDVLAGLALTGILVPAGMAYAEAAGLPASSGLYATIAALLVYALVGPSRILLLGPDSSLVPLIAVAVAPFATLGPDVAMDRAGALALMVGGLVAAAGAARLGFLTDLLSTPIRTGFVAGVALVIGVSQLPRLLGIEVGADALPGRLAAVVGALGTGGVPLAPVAVGVLSLVAIIVLRAWRPGFPGVLVAVVVATLVSAALDLPERTGLVTVGPLPGGLPLPHLPTIDIAVASSLLPAALSIAFVSAADSVILSRAFAARRGEPSDADRELLALGVVNAAAACFAGHPVSTSSSRTAVAESAGARTQLTAVVGALAIAVMLLAAPGLLADLPQPTLAAVVMGAAVGLVDPNAFVRLWQRRRLDLALALTTFAGVAVIGVVQGILIAVGLALTEALRRTWRPHDAILGRATGVSGYHDLTYYPEARLIPGLVLYRFDAPLLFFNGETFRERVLAAVARADPPARWVIVAAEPITDVDTTAAEALELLLDELAADNVTLAFAELKDPVKDRLRSYGTLARIGEDRCYPTVGTAVDGYVAATGAEWVDWKDAPETGP